MSVRYASASLASLGRGPKSSQPVPWFRRRAASRTSSYSASSIALGAVAHTKTAWSQLVASTSASVGCIRVVVRSNYNLGNSNTLMLDFGVGAAGSETVIAANIACGGGANTTYGGIVIEIPVAIPASTRVAVRAQSARTSWTANYQAVLLANSDIATTPASVTVIGTSTSTSAGTAMSGSSGTYVQITASTAADYQAVIIVPSISATSSQTNSAVTFTLATGAAGSEVDVGQCVAVFDGGVGVGNVILPGYCGGFIPAGTRLSVKHNISSSPGSYDICLIGVPYA